MLNEHGPIESFPPEVLGGERRELALLFKDIATLRTDAELFETADDLRWRGRPRRSRTWRNASATAGSSSAAWPRRRLTM